MWHREIKSDLTEFCCEYRGKRRIFLGGLIETDECVCIYCLQTQFWHNKVCYSDMKSPFHVKDEAQRCSVGKSETLRHTQQPFPPGFNTSCGEESGTSVRQISVVLYRTRLSSAPSSSPAFICRTSIAGSWKCQSAPTLSKRTAHCHQFTQVVNQNLLRFNPAPFGTNLMPLYLLLI